MLSRPTTENPGSGLSVLRPSYYIPEPTLFISPAAAADPLELPAHLRIASIRTIVPYDRVLGARRKVVRRFWQFLFLAEFSLRAILAAAGFRPDIVIVGIMNIFPGLALKSLAGARLVLTFHNLTEIEFVVSNRLVRGLVSRADLIFVVSAPLQEKLAGSLPGRAIVVRPTGVDLATFSPAGRDRKLQIVTVGSFKWKKGYAYLLEAFLQIRDRIPGVRWVVVGGGSEDREFDRMVREHDLGDRIVVTGIVPQAAVAEFLNESRVFVLASLREGLPKALLEALATGTPAVVTTGCNAGDFIGEAGIEVPVADAPAMADAVIRLFEDEPLWRRFAEKAPGVAERFSWEAIGRIERQALETLL